jgi:hypothetical protein
MRKQITFNWHTSETSVLEGALARGDRRVGAVIERAFRSGTRLDGWGEFFRWDIWKDAFEREGLDMAFYAGRARDPEETLPWSHISLGVSLSHLKNEREKAYRGIPTPDCRSACAGCGAGALGGECSF